jgi:ATP-dependent 26S proteasome regulatory subunit
LEEHIELTLPNTDDIREILESHLSNVPVSDDLNFEEFAEVFFELNATAADIEGVCRDACSIAIRVIDNPDSISLTYSTLDKALRNWKL